jgi:Domain of unknown function (DUF5664)
MNNAEQLDPSVVRADSSDKLQPARVLSAPVMVAYLEYMQETQRNLDGTVGRAPDNWKKGISQDSYMSSLMRHILAVWAMHQAGRCRDEETGDELSLELCAVLFNAMGYLHEELRARPWGHAAALKRLREAKRGKIPID